MLLLLLSSPPPEVLELALLRFGSPPPTGIIKIIVSFVSICSNSRNSVWETLLLHSLFFVCYLTTKTQQKILFLREREWAAVSCDPAESTVKTYHLSTYGNNFHLEALASILFMAIALGCLSVERRAVKKIFFPHLEWNPEFSNLEFIHSINNKDRDL